LSDFKLYESLLAKGGFIVFDDFMDTGWEDGVRKGTIKLIHDDVIDVEKFNIIGVLPNKVGAKSWFQKDDALYYQKKKKYAWQNVTSNEFVIQKR